MIELLIKQNRQQNIVLGENLTIKIDIVHSQKVAS